MTDHPAKFTDAILTVISKFLETDRLYLDPFAGTGKVHKVVTEAGSYSVGLEIEPEWATMHPQTVVGDALHMPFGDNTFEGIVTSPTYANRVADHHEARDDSKRITYRHKLGRALHPNNSGQLQWGTAYQDFHLAVFREILRVCWPDSTVLWNVSNHIRKGEEIKVVEWHRAAMIGLGFRYNGRVHINTPRMGFGANGGSRVPTESLLVFRTPLLRRGSGDTLGISRTTPASSGHPERTSMTDTTYPEADAPEDSLSTEAPEVTDGTDAAGADTEDDGQPEKVRRGRGFLETDVKTITDKFVTGEISLSDGELLTPHRIARLIQSTDSLDKPPSTGAVANILDTWAEIGFAALNDKPKAFLDYTETGREEGLTALKAAQSDAKKAQRKAAKEAAKAAEAPADTASE